MDKNLPATLRRAENFAFDLFRKLHPETRFKPWYIEVYQEAAEELERRNDNHWFRPKDKLPESGDAVLTLVNGSPHENVSLIMAYQIARFYDDDGWVIDEWPEWEGAEVVFWTPLPEPPEEGQ